MSGWANCLDIPKNKTRVDQALFVTSRGEGRSLCANSNQSFLLPVIVSETGEIQGEDSGPSNLARPLWHLRTGRETGRLS